MAIQTRVVTMKGQPLALSGSEVNLGDRPGPVELVGNNLSAVKLSDFAGKVCIISAVPSLDTPVCDTQTRKFNEAVGELGGEAVVVTVSMDLPFAQARWCGAAGLDNAITLSDYKEAAFGKAFGVLIEQLRLLARAVFVADRDGTIKYTQIVDELTNEPDYEAALNAAKELL